MKTEYLIWSLTAVLLLTIGLIIGRWATERPVASTLASPDDAGFRGWFWERRTLDLIIQVGLVFAGALGVAAILPEQDESGSSEGAATSTPPGPAPASGKGQ